MCKKTTRARERRAINNEERRQLLHGDERGRPYLLYTFGLDGIDNSGREPAGNNPRLAMTSAEDGRGYDYVFNRPREAWDLD